MKKYFALFFIFFCFLLTSCFSVNDDTETPKKSLDEQSREVIVTDGPIEEIFDVAVSYANWSEEGQIFLGCLNGKKMYESKTQHLPIFKFDTVEELEQFKERMGDYLTFDSGYDEIPSFNEVMSKYDEGFFDENTVILVYVQANSGSYRFGVNSVCRYGKCFCVHVEQTNSPTEVTCDMAGWFITLCVADDAIADCTEFDADLNNVNS